MRTIKTSELYRAILLYDLDSINEHPEIYSAHEVVESMKVVDMVVGQIAVDIYDDGNDEIPDYFEISRMDFDISYGKLRKQAIKREEGRPAWVALSLCPARLSSSPKACTASEDRGAHRDPERLRLALTYDTHRRRRAARLGRPLSVSCPAQQLAEGLHRLG